MRLLFSLMALGLLMASPLHAQPSADARRQLVQAVAREELVPRYTTLAAAMAAQEAAWTGFCATPTKAGSTGVQAAFQQAADAWSGVEFILYGPISRDYRFERMAHWPERNNAVGRGVQALLARSGDDLSPERFASVSAASQGLTALERLLFDGNAPDLYFATGEAATRRCAVSSAIAAGLARTSSQVLAEWTGPNGALAALETADAPAIDEALTRLVTDHITSLEIIYDKKLSAVLGKTQAEVRPTLAEGWRSGLSMRAIIINLEAIAALTRALAPPPSGAGASVGAALETAHHVAATLPPDIGRTAADPKQRPRLILLRDAVRSARDLAELSLPDALGVIIGFNSRDGD
ncbi:imelysin family protein [Microvirga antarctica]|uniref:imelysin family protein n=1 Tax=Microvirga antarctica TaxID=2819233 RepID=UPI001B30BB22|nr:imelysin family protein [Microvirga antarctica]